MVLSNTSPSPGLAMSDLKFPPNVELSLVYICSILDLVISREQTSQQMVQTRNTKLQQNPIILYGQSQIF